MRKVKKYKVEVPDSIPDIDAETSAELARRNASEYNAEPAARQSYQAEKRNTLSAEKAAYDRKALASRVMKKQLASRVSALGLSGSGYLKAIENAKGETAERIKADTAADRKLADLSAAEDADIARIRAALAAKYRNNAERLNKLALDRYTETIETVCKVMKQRSDKNSALAYLDRMQNMLSPTDEMCETVLGVCGYGEGDLREYRRFNKTGQAKPAKQHGYVSLF